MASFSLARYAAGILSAKDGGKSMLAAAQREFEKSSLIPIKPFKYSDTHPSVREAQQQQYLVACEFLSPASLAVFKEVRFAGPGKVLLQHPSGDIYAICINADSFPHALSKNGLPMELNEKKWWLSRRMSALSWVLHHLE
jgi:hypothetical protein